MNASERSATGDVVRHYDNLLASVYVWMIGGLDAALERNRELFERLGLQPQPSTTARALDVGAGPGPQSLALAGLGYRVTALDPCEPLLETLREEARVRDFAVEAIADGAPLGERHPGPFTLITCMVDTLVSLPDRETAQQLIHEASTRLAAGGALVLSWRDLTAIPGGDARFLPVRSDANRILTCFLEAVDAQHVRVHDLLHERGAEGFAQNVSSYLKLRLAPETVDAWLNEAGLRIEQREVERGMHLRLARRL